MTAPNPGDVLEVIQPGGPTYRLRYLRLDYGMPGPHEPGWLWLHGYLIRDGVESSWPETVYARPVDGHYEMVPRAAPKPPLSVTDPKGGPGDGA